MLHVSESQRPLECPTAGDQSHTDTAPEQGGGGVLSAMSIPHLTQQDTAGSSTMAGHQRHFMEKGRPMDFHALCL